MKQLMARKKQPIVLAQLSKQGQNLCVRNDVVNQISDFFIIGLHAIPLISLQPE